jgi:hypothetical protein
VFDTRDDGGEFERMERQLDEEFMASVRELDAARLPAPVPVSETLMNGDDSDEEAEAEAEAEADQQPSGAADEDNQFAIGLTEKLESVTNGVKHISEYTMVKTYLIMCRERAKRVDEYVQRHNPRLLEVEFYKRVHSWTCWRRRAHFHQKVTVNGLDRDLVKKHWRKHCKALKDGCSRGQFLEQFLERTGLAEQQMLMMRDVNWSFYYSAGEAERTEMIREFKRLYEASVAQRASASDGASASVGATQAGPSAALQQPGTPSQHATPSDGEDAGVPVSSELDSGIHSSLVGMEVATSSPSASRKRRREPSDNEEDDDRSARQS